MILMMVVTMAKTMVMTKMLGPTHVEIDEYGLSDRQCLAQGAVGRRRMCCGGFNCLPRRSC